MQISLINRKQEYSNYWIGLGNTKGKSPEQSSGQTWVYMAQITLTTSTTHQLFALGWAYKAGTLCLRVRLFGIISDLVSQTSCERLGTAL